MAVGQNLQDRGKEMQTGRLATDMVLDPIHVKLVKARDHCRISPRNPCGTGLCPGLSVW